MIASNYNLESSRFRLVRIFSLLLLFKRFEKVDLATSKNGWKLVLLSEIFNPQTKASYISILFNGGKSDQMGYKNSGQY